jgi:hypothetical protein
LLALTGLGMWQFGKYRYLFIFYTLATFGVISLFSAPSENRYITPLLPFLEVSLVIGLYVVISFVVRRLSLAKKVSPWLLLVLLFFSVPKLEALHKQNKASFPPAYQNYFKIAEEIHKKYPANAVICSRKPELFYMYSRTPVTTYAWTEDDRELLRSLVLSKTDYVVLEQLGYSSTSRYLFPAIQKHPDLFELVMHLPNPDTYLLKFNIEKAQAAIN